MKISSFKNVIVPLLFVGEVFFFGSAALAAGNKAIIGYGWDFLEATTEDGGRGESRRLQIPGTARNVEFSDARNRF